MPTRIQSTKYASPSYRRNESDMRKHHYKAAIKCPPDMHITKAHNLDRVLVKITKPETNVEWNEYVDCVPESAKRLEIFAPNGATEVTFRARSPYSNQFDICRVIINVVEPSLPVVTFCPDPFTVQLNQFETSRPLFWKEATFESKQPLKHIFKSNAIGSQFGVGVHPIVYVATTFEGLSAKCNFKITVTGKVFEDYNKIENGTENKIKIMRQFLYFKIEAILKFLFFLKFSVSK